MGRVSLELGDMLNRKKVTKNIFGENSFFLFGIGIAGILLLLDSFSLIQPFRDIFSFTFTPVYASAKTLSGNVKEYFGTVGKIDEFRKEYNDLKIAIYEKDINNAYYQVLLEENASLKKQIELGNTERKYLLSKVLGVQNISNMQIDKGTREGVRKGAVVSSGNMFVGTVESVDMEGALVLLPYSKSSTFEVFVTNVGVKDGKIVEGVPVLSHAVVRGGGDHINIENISMNSEVKDGDIVVTRDSKIDRYLIVGQIANLVSNPAATSKSARVAPLMDYDNLMTIFVEID